ncbi:MAG: hypothetical protein EOO88_26380, partial [Pedobacter sp.]
MRFGEYNIVTGNMIMSFPLCGWTCKGQGFNFTLFFNSKSVQDTTTGPGWSHTFSWHITGSNPKVVVSGDGTEIPFSVSSSGYTPPSCIHDSLADDTNGGWILTRSDNSRYYFNASGLLTSITANGNTTSCTYSAGLLTSVSDAVGRTLTLGYAGGKLATVTDYENRQWTILTTANGVSSIAEPPLNGNTYTQSFGYTLGNLTSVTDKLGRVWSYAYDPDSFLTQMTDPDNKQWQLRAANSTYAPPSTEDSLEQEEVSYVWPYDVSAVGVLTNPGGSSVSFGCDSLGRVVAFRGETDDRAVFSYDASNNKISQQNDTGVVW